MPNLRESIEAFKVEFPVQLNLDDPASDLGPPVEALFEYAKAHGFVLDPASAAVILIFWTPTVLSALEELFQIHPIVASRQIGLSTLIAEALLNASTLTEGENNDE